MGAERGPRLKTLRRGRPPTLYTTEAKASEARLVDKGAWYDEDVALNRWRRTCSKGLDGQNERSQACENKKTWNSDSGGRELAVQLTPVSHLLPYRSMIFLCLKFISDFLVTI